MLCIAIHPIKHLTVAQVIFEGTGSNELLSVPESPSSCTGPITFQYVSLVAWSSGRQHDLVCAVHGTSCIEEKEGGGLGLLSLRVGSCMTT